jgi:hypothetical protein
MQCRASGPDWLIEIKHDGFRVIARKAGNRVPRLAGGLYRAVPSYQRSAAALRRSVKHDGFRVIARKDGYLRRGLRGLLADPLRVTQVATAPVVTLTGLLSLFYLDVVTEDEPFQTTAHTMRIDIGWVAIAAGYGVVSDVAELGTEGAVGDTAQFGLPHERCLRHSPRSG